MWPACRAALQFLHPKPLCNPHTHTADDCFVPRKDGVEKGAILAWPNHNLAPPKPGSSVKPASISGLQRIAGQNPTQALLPLLFKFFQPRPTRHEAKHVSVDADKFIQPRRGRQTGRSKSYGPANKTIRLYAYDPLDVIVLILPSARLCGEKVPAMPQHKPILIKRGRGYDGLVPLYAGAVKG
jgi:hypothetical protein